MTERVTQVIKQTHARIFEGNTKSPDKLVSVFEPHTEIIRKGKASKPTEFGKMVKLQEAENQIVTHYEVFEGPLSISRARRDETLGGIAPESSYAFSESTLRKSGPCGAVLMWQLRPGGHDDYASKFGSHSEDSPCPTS